MIPKISIVTTFYNYEKYLRQCIESVLAQTESNFELILYDDGSQDNSLQIAMDYLTDPRVIVIQTEHKGRGYALATAMLKATAEYIGWLDADDWLHPQCLELLRKFLDDNQDVGLVYSQYYQVNENGENPTLGHKCLVPYMGRDTLLLAFMVFHFRLFRKEIYYKSGGIDSFFQAATDYDFCLKVSEICEIAHLPIPLYYYRVHASSMSHARKPEQSRYAQIAKENALKRRGYL